MASLGYAWLIEQLALRVCPLAKPAEISTSVNRRVDTPHRVFFPRGVAVEDTPVGHLEFALRHEGVKLEIVDAVFEHLSPADLCARQEAAPNGAPIRRACFLWEWLTGQDLPITVTPAGGYVDLFPAETYVTAGTPVNNRKFRVRNNALGTPDFCPVVLRSAVPESPSLTELLAKAQQTLESVSDPALYERALNFLYLSETRSSFEIEREKPSSDKQERFVQLLRRAGETPSVSEDWLVSLQNAVVRDVFSQEASYRAQQNWLEDATGRITFFPVPVADLRRAMAGWETFVNDNGALCPDVLVKVACAAFGFVYLHPFMDGNGRLHRFLIHHVLTQTEMLSGGRIVPVSAVILKHIPEYLEVLAGFSRPVTRLWEYVRGEMTPHITVNPGSRAYRFFDASREVAFLYRMIHLAVEEEIPRELAWLSGFDQALDLLESEFDLPQKDLATLIRMAYSNHGRLSANRRKQYSYLPVSLLDRIETVVQACFDAQEGADTRIEN